MKKFVICVVALVLGAVVGAVAAKSISRCDGCGCKDGKVCEPNCLCVNPKSKCCQDN